MKRKIDVWREYKSSKLSEYFSAFSRLSEKGHEKECANFRIKNKKLLLDMLSLKRFVEDEKAKAYDLYQKDHPKKDDEFSNKLKELSEIVESSNDNFEAIFEAIIETGPEVMGILVRSLYFLHLDDSYIPNFVNLNKQDLEFLERFEYKGQSIFGKGISKYRLALEMLEEGMSVEDTRDILYYATKIEWKSTIYEFPESNVRIIGDIQLK